MTGAMILEVPGVTEARYVTAWGLLGAARHPGNLVQIAGPTSTRWRVVDVWASPAVLGAVFPADAPLVADASDGDPTWEDAEWQ
jgi:hypothetical protein